MIPKEKAIELVDKYLNYVNCWGDDGNADYEMANRYAKQCALIAVDEMISEAGRMKSSYMGRKRYEYLLEVKQEIEKL
jgi:hypothetical protein